MRARLLVALALVAGACSASSDTAELATLLSEAAPGDSIQLAPGRYEGSVVIDQPVTLAGGPGVVIVAPDDSPAITITDTTGVTIRDIRIEGGSDGILVRRSEAVVIEDVTVEQALWHGIVAQDSEVHVLNCSISGLRAPMPQGIEIINSDTRPQSTVKGCHIVGPVFEGIVSHVSHVTFEDNVVTGATARGVVITEMSDGLMQGNTVRDSEGNAYFCGDMSSCSVIDNEAVGIIEGDGHRSAQGHGLVVHFHSRAFVSGFRVEGLSGEEMLLMLDSAFLEDAPYP